MQRMFAEAPEDTPVPEARTPIQLSILEQVFSIGIFPVPEAPRGEFDKAMEIRNFCESLILTSASKGLSSEDADVYTQQLHELCRKVGYEPEVVEDFFIINSMRFAPYVRAYLSCSKEIAIH